MGGLGSEQTLQKRRAGSEDAALIISIPKPKKPKVLTLPLSSFLADGRNSTFWWIPRLEWTIWK